MVLTFIAVLVCFFGNYLSGLFIMRRLSCDDLGSVLPAFLIGAAVNTSLLTIWSFFGPISPIYSCCIVAVLAVLVGLDKQFRQAIHNDFRVILDLPIYLKGLIAAIFLGAIMAATETASGYDEGLYYIQVVKWLQEYGTLPGLGNLHNRFAYNASWHTLAAGFTFISDGYYNDLGIALFLAMSMFVVSQLAIVIKLGFDIRLFFLLVWVFLLTNVFPKANSLSADSPAFVVGFLMSYYVLLAFTNKLSITRSRLLIMFTLLVWAITIKLSALLLAGLTLSLLTIYFWQVVRSSLGWLVLIGLLVMVPFAVRGWVLSGYLFYPLTVSAVGSPDWKIPVAEVIAERLSIENAAKLVSGDLMNESRHIPLTEWFVLWAQKTKGDNLLPILLSIIAASLLMFWRRSVAKPLLFFVVMLVFLTVYMMYNVPDLRFIFSQPWAVIAIAAGFLGTRISQKYQLYTVYGLAIVQAIGFILIGINAARQYDNNLVAGSPAPSKPVHDWYTQDHKVVHVVSEGDQCWNSSFPCIPSSECGQFETRSGTYASGFRVVKPR